MKRRSQFSRWIVIAFVVGTSAAFATGQTAQRPERYSRNPFADTNAATRQFEPSVKLVKLNSCDPAVLSKPTVPPKNILEAAERNHTRADLDAYHAILTAYAEGDAAGSVTSVLSLPRDRLLRALASINNRNIHLHAPWDARQYAIAVMLHTDAALQLAGNTYGNEMFDQLQVAADLLQLGVRCAPDLVRPLAPRWYVGLSRYLRDRTALYPSEALLELGRARLENEPAILGESGLLAESIATMYALSPTRSSPSWAGGDGQFLPRIVERRRAWLEEAVTWLGQAAKLEPGNDETRLHLGRARALKFDDDEALGTLGAVLARTPSDDVGYLAAIFIAAVHDRQGRLDDAAAAYRAALARVPDGHAARVGLADVLRRAGQVDEARGVLRALVMERSGEIREPLWWYLIEPPGMADARLAELRAEVRR